MGSPISGTLAEIFLQQIEEYNVKHWIENGDLFYYRRYVDDLFITIDTRNTDDNINRNKMNSINSHLKFKIIAEANRSIDYLDMTITRKSEGIEISIYRKPTNPNITLHQQSNHPRDHKDAAYRYYVNRMTGLPNTKHAMEQERSRIMNIAKHNGYPKQYINDMIRKQATRNRLPIRNTEDTLTAQKPKTKWITFTYHSPLIRKVTNLFRNTQIQIAFKTTNTIQQLLTNRTHNRNPSGIYEITCNTCKQKYVGQSGRGITLRYREHIRYIRTNNNSSAYATHILDNRQSMARLRIH